MRFKVGDVVYQKYHHAHTDRLYKRTPSFYVIITDVSEEFLYRYDVYYCINHKFYSRSVYSYGKFDMIMDYYRIRDTKLSRKIYTHRKIKGKWLL